MVSVLFNLYSNDQIPELQAAILEVKSVYKYEDKENRIEFIIRGDPSINTDLLHFGESWMFFYQKHPGETDRDTYMFLHGYARFEEKIYIPLH